MAQPIYPAAAIPANLRILLAMVLASLSPEVLLAILDDRNRGNGRSRLQEAIRLQDVLKEAVNHLNNLQTDQLGNTVKEEIEVAEKRVSDAREVLLNFLEERRLVDDPPTQVETTTKTILP